MELPPLRAIRNVGRFIEIVSVLVRHGFGEVVDQLRLWRYVPRLKRRTIQRGYGMPSELTLAHRLRLALEDLGPTAIKFGQVISTRPDLIPPEIIEELTHLQENVPAFPSETAVALVEAELGRPVGELFAEFDRTPFAAGSLGQVHRARHHDGTPLAVKIRRPNIVREVERDISLLKFLAASAQQTWLAPFDPQGLVQHFSRTIRREMNFRREARTIQEFDRLFEKDATLYVPRVYDDLTTEAVVTMEFIDGCRPTDSEALRNVVATKEQLAVLGTHIFMRMAFEFGMFHGDPHPGNIRVLPDGSLALIDYGMVGMLSEDNREQLVDLFLAVAQQDVARAERLVRRMGRPSRPIDDVLLRADVQDFIETYYGLSLERLNVGGMLNDFLSIMIHHGLRCPADLMLLIRATVTLEGVGRTLDPHFNLAAEIAPFVERIVRRRYEPQRIMERTLDDARHVLGALHDLPSQLGRTLQKLATDDLRIQLEHRELDNFVNEFDRSSNRIVVGLITSSLIVASALVLRAGTGGYWLSALAFLASCLFGAWVVWGIMRSGRL
ncbi:MAG: AarF/ABC1/UbiB kinase family protein [Planctomycetaceae bacterium]|nr:AarF/ABC1/UbiB kinase family protein [Planctomycetaceae bacterium]